MGARRVLVVASRSQASAGHDLARSLGALAMGVVEGTRQHVPRADVDRLVGTVDACDADVVVALGGGSTVGLAKAVALERPISVAAVPTTYSGSEMTPIWGVTDDEGKSTGRSDRVQARLVVYDPAVTVRLPVAASVTSLINAMAHAVEALWAPDARRPILDRAEEAVRVLAATVPRIRRSPHDLEVRAEALYGAYVAGDCLASASMGLHHKVCHVLGGTFGLPHAEAHAVVLPHVVALVAPAVPEARTRLERALRTPEPALALRDLAASAGAPTSLEPLGFRAADVERAARLVVDGAYDDPRRAGVGEVSALLARALHGAPPAP